MTKENIKQLMSDIKINYSCSVYYQITKDRDFDNPVINELWYGDFKTDKLCVANMDFQFHETKDYQTFYNELIELEKKFQIAFDSLRTGN